MTNREQPSGGVTRQWLFDTLALVLSQVVVERGYPRPMITPETSVVDDLGLDSMTMTDLTLRLEDALRVRRFPIHASTDAEAVKAANRYSVASLADCCARLLGIP